jgi:hypothetical protein
MRGEKVPNEPFDGKDLDSLDLPAVERLADERNRKINEAGAYVTGLYWDLGRFLLRLQELCGKKHGEWEKRLQRIAIERTRATKAVAIRNAFREREDCEQMPVAKAYAMRKRKKTVEYESPQPPDNSCFSPNDSIHVYNCRLQDLEGLGGVKPNTVDLLTTDPPYVGEWLPQIPDLAALAARVLKPGGLAVYYYGNYYLNVLIREMEKHLRYVWTFCHPYQPDGLKTISNHGIEQCWKPVVVFAKGDWRSPRKIEDMLPDFGREKSRDYWEQSLPLLEHFLEMFSQPGDLVLDPLAGTCTIMEACHDKGRRCVACDSNPAALAHARQRWEAIKRGIYDDLHSDAAGGEVDEDGEMA